MSYCTDCEMYNECDKDIKDDENIIMCFARIRPLMIKNVLDSDEFKQKVLERADEILKDRGDNHG